MHKLKLSLSDSTFHRFGFISQKLEPVFKFAKEAGYDGLELTESITTRWMGSKRISALARHHNLPITSVHQSFARMMWASVGSIKRLLSRARDLGARCAVVHLASVHRAFQNKGYYQKIKDLEQRYGVPVAFENAMAQFSRFKSRSFTYAHDPRELQAGMAANDLNFTYDVGHMGSLAPNPSVFYDAVRSRLLNIHLQDYKDGNDHLSLGDGELPLKFFLQHLAQTKYNGLVTLEVFPLIKRPFMGMSRVKEILKCNLEFFRKHTQED